MEGIVEGRIEGWVDGKYVGEFVKSIEGQRIVDADWRKHKISLLHSLRQLFILPHVLASINPCEQFVNFISWSQKA
jgi:hypothetical protein